MLKKVSIIIPVFNVENYLEECLSSAVGQDYESIEIIIVDDGSTDSSGKIIDTFKNRYSFVQSVKTKNQGQSSARNLGLEMATGDYILFLDSDDWLEKNTVSVCIKTINDNRLDIVLFSAEAFIDGEAKDITKMNKFYSRSTQLNKVLLSRNVFTEELKLNKYIVQPCMYMFNRIKYLNLRFYPSIIYEDNLFTTQLLLQHCDATAMCLPNKFFHRRFRPQSTVTQSKQQRHIDCHLVVIDELAKMLPHFDGSEKKALKHLITNLLFYVLLMLNPVYGWHIPTKVRFKLLFNYFNYCLLPFNLKLFFKFMIPGSFSLWRRIKDKHLSIV